MEKDGKRNNQRAFNIKTNILTKLKHLPYMRHEAHLQAIENSMLNEQTDVERKAIIYHCDQIRRSRMFLEKRLERIEKKLRRFEKETLTPNGMQLIGLNQKAA